MDMRAPSIPRPSATTVIAVVAICLAVGGSAYAGTRLGKGSVDTRSIRKKAVTRPKLAPAAVSQGKLANGAVTAEKIASGAVTDAGLAKGAVRQSKFAVSDVAHIDGDLGLAAGECKLATFTAPGVEQGDIVLFSARQTSTINPEGGPVSVSPASNAGFDEVSHNELRLGVCNLKGSPEVIGDLTLQFAALR